nr:beta-amyrin 28-oxidase-like [Tanacetum cinerariifolium]
HDDEAKWMRKMLLPYLGPDAFARHYAITMDVVTRHHIKNHWQGTRMRGVNNVHVTFSVNSENNFDSVIMQSLILYDLEFKKLSMVHGYVGRNKMEDFVSIEDAIRIRSLKTMPMLDFEDWMRTSLGVVTANLMLAPHDLFSFSNGGNESSFVLSI